MNPTFFLIIEEEMVQKMFSSDFSTHLVPLQKHSLVVRHFTHSGRYHIQYLCEGSKRT